MSKPEESRTQLPVEKILPELLLALEEAPNAVVQAPPGAGKTTRLPVALLRTPWLKAPHNRVIVLQPRRVAARAAAARIAAENRWELGRQVGFHVRFDRRVGRETRLVLQTEGILARQLQSDPELHGIGCVILDEFHERSIHTDLALALLREVQEGLRDDLRIIVMSATMEAAPVAKFLVGAPVIRSEGRLFPVDVEYDASDRTESLEDRAAEGVRRALALQPEGHVLAFLPGMREIRRTEQRLGAIDAACHVLHSSVSPEDQDRALAPTARRKVILATNIAETSLTIEGVRAVVDSGWERVQASDARLGIDRLELQRISVASADQRAGRAGRTAPGICLRLWSRRQHASLPPTRPPEVARIDLAQTILALKMFGVGRLEGFRWFEAPPPAQLARAAELLRLLDALDGDERLTDRGRELAALPLHPRLGTLLLEGKKAGLERDAAALAALLSEGPPRGRRAGAAAVSSDSDLLLLLDDPQGLPPHIARLRQELLRHLQADD